MSLFFCHIFAESFCDRNYIFIVFIFHYNPSVFLLRKNPPPFTQGRLFQALNGRPYKKERQRRGFIKQYPLQKQSFNPILQKIAMVGVILTIAIFFVLVSKSSLLKCVAVLRPGFLPLTKNSHAEILCVFQGVILQLQGKRMGQNRIMFYGTPPNCLSFYYSSNKGVEK